VAKRWIETQTRCRSAPASRRRLRGVGFVFALLPSRRRRRWRPRAEIGAGPASGAGRKPTGAHVLIARSGPNTVVKGDVAILRRAGPRSSQRNQTGKWGVAPAVLGGDGDVSVVVGPGLELRSRTVTLELRVAASVLPTPGSPGPERRAGMISAEDSFFLNYGFNAAGDDGFNQRQYSSRPNSRRAPKASSTTTSQQWEHRPKGFTRLLATCSSTIVEPAARTIGDFSPRFDLNGGAAGRSDLTSSTRWTRISSVSDKRRYDRGGVPSTVQVRIAAI
jgi:hypothetical protein